MRFQRIQKKALCKLRPSPALPLPPASSNLKGVQPRMIFFTLCHPFATRAWPFSPMKARQTKLKLLQKKKATRNCGPETERRPRFRLLCGDASICDTLPFGLQAQGKPTTPTQPWSRLLLRPLLLFPTRGGVAPWASSRSGSEHDQMLAQQTPRRQQHQKRRLG
jgi:hypothetical protein